MLARERAWPDWAMHPGRSLEVDMEEAGIDASDLAALTGIPETTLHALLHEEIGISEELAHALARAKPLRTPAAVWLGSQKGYEQDLAVIEARAKADLELDELDRFPFQHAADAGWVTPHRDPRDRVRALWEFFNVDTLREFKPDPATEFRLAEPTLYDPIALAMWLRKGEIDVANTNLRTYDQDAFISALADIKLLTKRAPSAYLPLIRERCADAGVAFIVVEALPGSGARSVTRWRHDGTPWIQLNVDHEWLDTFWWSFYLEATHVLQGVSDAPEVLHFGNPLLNGCRDRTVNGTSRHHVNGSGNGAAPSEDDVLDDQRAAHDARQWLLFDTDWDRIVSVRRFTYEHVARCADEIAIHPGIIVSRLQAEGIIPHTHLNKVRERSTPPAGNAKPATT